MKAMILAAGIGERMRPLTDHVPKPLLKVGDHALIEYHLFNLAKSGFVEVVINTAYLAEQIEQHLGDGSRFELKITYSREPKPMETAGGIQHALSLLGEAPFLVINADIWMDYPLAQLRQLELKTHAHLVMVDNPAHHAVGDFIVQNGMLKEKEHDDSKSLTFSGLSVLSPELFHRTLSSVRLVNLFKQLIVSEQISAEYYDGTWVDVGTPERLEMLRWQVQNGG